MIGFIDIPDLKGHFKINRSGEVYSMPRPGTRTHEPTIIKELTNEKGYKIVHLTVNGKQKKYKVHRLVALCYVPNPDNKPEVNHKDGDKSNNNDWNLEWATHLENMQHAWKTGLKKGVVIPRKLNWDKVNTAREQYKNGSTITELAKLHQVSISNMHELVNNTIWKQ